MKIEDDRALKDLNPEGNFSHYEFTALRSSICGFCTELLILRIAICGQA